MNLEEVYQEVEKLDPEKFMSILKKLIGIKTVVPPANNYREYVDAISPYFKDLGFSLEEVVIPGELVKQILLPLEGPRINLVATKEYGQKDYVSFYGHMDVVPAPTEGEEKWRFPPFEATMIKSGKIYGRGVADMKGAMVCLIVALQIMEKLKLTPKYNIRILNGTDEETGIYPGSRYLAEQGYVKGVVFCMDLSIEPMIPLGTAGDLDVIVETIGKSCHSGMNFLGVNALEEMIPILDELYELKQVVERRESKDIPGFRELGTGKALNMRPMFNLDIIRGGEKSNIVPDSCVLTINRRIIPDEKYEDVKQEIADAIERGKAKSKALDVKVTYDYAYPALRIDPKSPNVKRFEKAISLVQETPEEKIIKMGLSITTDMGYVSEALGTNDIILTGLANLRSSAHGVNETIRMKDVKTFIKEILVFLCADV